MPVEAGDNANVVRIDRYRPHLRADMPQMGKGYCPIVNPLDPEVAQESGTPLGVPMQADLGGAETAIVPRLRNEVGRYGGRAVGVRRGDVVPFPVRSAGRPVRFRGLPPPGGATTTVIITDDDLRAIWLVQVMAMMGMTAGFGGCHN